MTSLPAVRHGAQHRIHLVARAPMLMISRAFLVVRFREALSSNSERFFIIHNSPGSFHSIQGLVTFFSMSSLRMMMMSDLVDFAMRLNR